MKKNPIKTLTAILLLIAFALCAVSCAQTASENTDGGTETGSPKTTENTETAEGTETEGDLPQAPLAQGGLSLNAGAAGGGLTYYLKLDGIEGDSRDAAHEKWIVVTEFSHGIEPDALTGGYSETYAPIVFTHTVDRATPNLQRFCMTKQTVSAGTFQAMETVAGASAAVYTVRFSGLRIVDSTVKNVTVNGANVLVEEVTMIAENETVEANNCANPAAKADGLAYYLKLDGVEGESGDSAHKRWVEPTDFSHGATREGQSVSGEGEFEPVVFTHRVGASSVKLQDLCFKGARISKGELHTMKSIAGRATAVYKVVLENVHIKNVTVRTVTAADGTPYLEEEIVLSVEKETWTYSAAGLDNTGSGASEAGYDQSRRA